jgi:hypothetical protein
VTTDRRALVEALMDLERQLKRYQDPYASVVTGVREGIESEDEAPVSPTDLDEVRRMFGGMASLNDIYISKANGHSVDNEEEANRKVDELRDMLWQLVADANELREN